MFTTHRQLLATACWALACSTAFAQDPAAAPVAAPSASPEAASASGVQPEPTAPTTGEGLVRAIASKVTLLGYAKVGFFWVTPGADDSLIGARSGW